LSFNFATREKRSKSASEGVSRAAAKRSASDSDVEAPRLEGPRYIVVEGPIGVGKTSLAKRLAKSFASELILEQAEENPFLERFYRNRKQSALPTQLFFLFQRARQIEQIRQSDMFSPVRIADFLLQKDRLFAELNLDPHELGLYQQVADTLELDTPTPDLVVYLQAQPKSCSSVWLVAAFPTSSSSSPSTSSASATRTPDSSMTSMLLRS